MKRIQKLIIFGLILFLSFILVCSTKLMTRLSGRSPIECGEIGLTNLEPSAGNASCAQGTFLFGPYYIVSLKKFHAQSAIKFEFKKPAGDITLTGQIIKAPPGSLQLTTSEGKLLWQSSGVGTEWSGASRALMWAGSNPEIFHLKSNSEFEYEIVLADKIVGALSSNILTCISLFVLTGLVFLLANQRPTSSILPIALLVTGLVLLTLWCGMPYGSTAGWFDPGDDTSYFHWAYNLGYLLDPNLTHGGLKSWASDHNHHTWGTGLMLAPFMFLARFFALGLGPGSLHFGLMNLGVIFWGCVGTVILFRAFAMIAGWRAAVTIALLSLVSTSMLKWMFMRNFFSHVPEMFAVATTSYFAIRRYFKNNRGMSGFCSMLLSLWPAVQIRRENLALFAVPFCYEWLLLQGRATREKFRDSTVIFFFVTLSVVSLQTTNYFTQLGSFIASSGTHSYFHLNDFLVMVAKNGPEVIWRESFGLFYWRNAYAWLAIGAAIIHRRSWRIWGPLAGLTLLFIMMCSLYEYPNGMEWQNRFMLKLNPILFGGAAIFLRDSIRPFKICGWVWMLVCAALEFDLYRNQLPTGMNFYINDLSDHGIMYPQSWPGASMAIFYIPLIAIIMISIFLWIRVYRTMRKAHSLGDT